MEKRIGDILIDLAPPERAKFKAPLVLVHGLWMSSRCWQSWSTHYSNLGWECWAVNFRGRYGEKKAEELKRLTLQCAVQDLRVVFRAAPFPPVVLAHDLGALAALEAAQAEKVSALILLAALPPRDVAPEAPQALKLMRLKYRPLVFFGRSFCVDEKDFRRYWLNAVPESRHGAALTCLVPDAPRLIAEFFARRVALGDKPISSPALVVAGTEDRLAPAAALERLAQMLGADFRVQAGRGHWVMDEEGGEEGVGDIHRWIVRHAGAEILFEENFPPA